MKRGRLFKEVDAALVADEPAHRLERARVGSEDGDELVRRVAAHDRGQLDERREEDGQTRVLPRERLQVHHEAAVARDRVDAVLIERCDRVYESCLHLVREPAALAHLEREARHFEVHDVVAKRIGMVNVARRRRILIVQPNHAE